jgi:predicted outer membrane lipoprotein
MLVKCKKCNKKYNRNNIGGYGEPYLCPECLRKKKPKGISFILVTLILSFTMLLFVQSAQAQEQIFKQNDIIDIKIQCIINGTFCSAGAGCNITLNYPNNTILLNNAPMTNANSYYNYTLNDSSVLGDYPCSVTCCDVGYCGTNQDCSFSITPSGLESSTANALYYFGALFMFVIFLFASLYGIWKVKKPWMKLLFVSMSYLLFIALSFVTWQISVNFITTIPFIQTILYFIWFLGLILFLPFIFVSGLWLLDMASKEKDIQKKIGMGYSEDEARNGFK